ncbi:Cof-type HAD-IIB family hydrolase [Vibrio sp. RC27]
MTKYKVLALDLDGTVLNSDRQISEPLRQTIQTLKDRVHIVLVTGRHHTAAKPYHYELGLDTPAICCNGTYVYDYAKQAILTQNAIPVDKAREFLALAQSYNFKLVMYVKDAMLYSKAQPIHYMEALKAWSEKFDGELRPDIRKVESFEDELNKTDYIWKYVVEGNDLAGFSSEDLIKNDFSGERSWVDRIDFAMCGNTKGNALSTYIETQGYHPDQVVAVGDNHNDISMIKLSGLGVAMGNADDTVKQSAQKVLQAGHDDANALSDFLNSIF